MPRDHWEQVDAERGERSLERKPEEEVFCLVQTKEGNQWTFPEIVLGQGETLDGAIESRITGTNGWFDGKTMDTWLVTKKPIGMIKKGKERVCPRPPPPPSFSLYGKRCESYSPLPDVLPQIAYPRRRAEIDKGRAVEVIRLAHKVGTPSEVVRAKAKPMGGRQTGLWCPGLIAWRPSASRGAVQGSIWQHTIVNMHRIISVSTSAN